MVRPAQTPTLSQLEKNRYFVSHVCNDQQAVFWVFCQSIVCKCVPPVNMELLLIFYIHLFCALAIDT